MSSLAFKSASSGSPLRRAVFRGAGGAGGKTDLFRTHEVPRLKAVLDTLKLV
ncbi:MAG TPA: hypothetical protein VF492_03930 [Verrucomicrobiae bacterium]